MSWNGTNWFVAWEDGRNDASDLFGARISSAGVLLDPAGIGISVNANSPYQANVTWNGVDNFVLWRELRAGTGYDVLAARVTVGGAVLDPGGFLIAGGPASEVLPALTVLGSDTLVLWTDNRTGASLAWGTEVSSSGGITVDGGIPWASPASNPTSVAIAAADAGLFVAWTDSARGNSDVLGALSTRAGVAAGVVVVWRDSTTSVREIALTRITIDGGVLDTPRARVSNTPGDDANPRLACAAGQCVVVWDTANPAAATGRLINAAQVTPNRTPAAVSAAVTTSAGTPVVIALSGTDADGDALTFAVTSDPDGGVLQGSPPSLTYQPSAGFSGPDELRFVVRDATRESLPAIIAITVLPGAVDAGGQDASVSDAGADDAGVPDAGLADAGTPDAGLLDAGEGDAGADDGGVLDAGIADGGVADAGVVDAGTPDGGAGNGVVAGCGCGAAPQSVVAFLLLTLMGRRRPPVRLRQKEDEEKTASCLRDELAVL